MVSNIDTAKGAHVTLIKALAAWQKGSGVCGIGIPFYWITFNIINLIQESIDPTAFSGTFEIPIREGPRPAQKV